MTALPILYRFHYSYCLDMSSNPYFIKKDFLVRMILGMLQKNSDFKF
ncbi:hypothetical protein LEP1GSC199_3730 [Leptospira vanthielii serovar Holland str. Waz Holland = ATCC 700522]|uniref:Uncharacterized protein n=1 Tax=Leptospira vanthielii serovar Holland str. Waz Holland = ATCC 700522 TaxID=1218591 RepID=N1W909_9LEPT|nr:hypothetical protein LEP1GSC199_3730 [Leptospira vanthielii serovar Holland str. Waz Holland = ATCC 700522]